MVTELNKNFRGHIVRKTQYKAVSQIRGCNFEFASLENTSEVITNVDLLPIQPSGRNPSSKLITASKPTANILISCQQLYLIA